MYTVLYIYVWFQTTAELSIQSNSRPVFTLNAVYMLCTRLSGSLSPVLLPTCASIDKRLRQRKCEYSCHTFQSICPFQLAWEQCFVSINNLSHVGHVTPRTNRLTLIVLHRNGCITKEHDQRNAKWNWQKQTSIFGPSVTEVNSLAHFRFLFTSTGCLLGSKWLNGSIILLIFPNLAVAYSLELLVIEMYIQIYRYVVTLMSQTLKDAL